MSIYPAIPTHAQILATALAEFTFNPATLTREKVLATAMADPIFVAGLKQLKAAEGFSPDSIHGIDDRVGFHAPVDINNVVVVVSFEPDGSPSKPRPDATAQDGYTDLPAWIMPGCYNVDGDSFDWGIYRIKNPLYVARDGKVHLSEWETGMHLSFHDEDKEFDTIVRKQRGVYTESRDRKMRTHEAHIWMTVAELAAL